MLIERKIFVNRIKNRSALCVDSTLHVRVAKIPSPIKNRLINLATDKIERDIYYVLITSQLIYRVVLVISCLLPSCAFHYNVACIRARSKRQYYICCTSLAHHPLHCLASQSLPFCVIYNSSTKTVCSIDFDYCIKF
jgi:hypothetical protein